METYAGAPTISIFNYKNKKLFRIWANLNTQQQDNKVTKVSHLLSGQSSPGVYNQDNNHQMPSYKSHRFHLGHPMSMMRQHATYNFTEYNNYGFLLYKK